MSNPKKAAQRFKIFLATGKADPREASVFFEWKRLGRDKNWADRIIASKPKKYPTGG
jgi:hypothetical protein